MRENNSRNFFGSVVLMSGIFLFVIVSNVTAQSFEAGPRAGLFLEDADLFIGVEADIELLSFAGVHLIPSVDKIFSDEGPGNVKLDSKWLFGFNAVYDFIPLFFGTPYAGGGLGFFRTKDEVNKTKNTDIAINIIGGIRFKMINNFRPFANARITLNGNDTSVIIEGGIHFLVF